MKKTRFKLRSGSKSIVALGLLLLSLAILVGCGGGEGGATQAVGGQNGNGGAGALQDVHYAFAFSANIDERIGNFNPEQRARISIDIDSIVLDPPLGNQGSFTMIFETTAANEIRLGDDVIVEINLDSGVRDNETLAAELVRQLNSDTFFARDYSALVRGGELRIEAKFLVDQEELTVSFD